MRKIITVLGLSLTLTISAIAVYGFCFVLVGNPNTQLNGCFGLWKRDTRSNIWNTGNTSGVQTHVMVSFGSGACGVRVECGQQSVEACWPDFYTPVSTGSSVTQRVGNKKAESSVTTCNGQSGQRVTCQNDYASDYTDYAAPGY